MLSLPIIITDRDDGRLPLEERTYWVCLYLFRHTEHSSGSGKN